MHRLTRFALVALLGSAPLAQAQTVTNGHLHSMDHTAHGVPGGAPVLTEPGQGAFAALSEVVAVLEADPETDWSKVDLNALRDHLVDMDRLVSDTVVREEVLPTGLHILASGDEATLATLRRMVPAHAAQLARDDRWHIEAIAEDTGVALTVTSDDPAIAARIKGLGFFGLMASQDHHRSHHLGIAQGRPVHLP